MLTRRLEALVARHGDDVLLAVRKAGPAAVRTIENAGVQGGTVARLLSQHGDDALRLVSQPRQLQLCVQHGDSAARAMLRHGPIAETAIDRLGAPGAHALQNLGTQNGRRLVMMLEQGELNRLGRTQALLDVIGKYGDRAMTFIWNHKGALTVGAVLAAFLADAEPFIHGIRDLASIGADAATKPVTAATKEFAGEVARQTNWTAVFLGGLGLLGLVYWFRDWKRKPGQTQVNQATIDTFEKKPAPGTSRCK